MNRPNQWRVVGGIMPPLAFGMIVVAVLASLFPPLHFTQLGETLWIKETCFALRLSLVSAVVSTFIAVVWGTQAGYVLARKHIPGKAFLDMVLDIPMVIPPLITGMGLLFLFGNNGLGNRLTHMGVDILFTPLGILTAQTFIAMPIMIRSSRAVFETVDERYEKAALTLGRHPVNIFFTITLPLAGKGLLAGAVLALARVLGEFGATLMIAGATRMKTETLPIAVYLNISSGEIGTALACAWILLAMGISLLIVLKVVDRFFSFAHEET